MDNSNEEKKYPKATVGAFIFNDKGELFLMKSPKWQNKYVCPGGGIEYGEKMVDSLRREVKEETNMRIDDIKFLGVSEGINLGDEYSKKEKHLLFLNYKAVLKGRPDIKLNEEAIKYYWLKPKEWLKKDLNLYTRKVLEEYLLEGDDLEGKYLRALADYQNLLKRTAEEKKEFAKYANESLLREFLPVYDNLKISMRHVDEQAGKNGWAEGIKYVIKQFKDALSSMGVSEIETVGKKFDPAIMEALEGRGEKVKEEVRPGYLLNGKVVVPARVVLEK
jgi:molecular chaperone GrpE